MTLVCMACVLPERAAAAEPERVRDRFWIFACVAGADNEGWGLKRPSRMTPAESCFYLDVPNLIMVRWKGKPPPPYDQYSIPFRPLKQVVWSVVGSGGETAKRETDAVFELAARTPNVTGIFMDDYFKTEGDKVAVLSLTELQALRKRLQLPDRQLDLWVVIYAHQLHRPVEKHVALCDDITLWTWRSADLKDLEANLTKLEKLAPGKDMHLGLYMHDYGAKAEIPVDRMKQQCQLGLKWLEEGRIESMIFLANTVADLDTEAVEWTRQWIAKVGDRPLETPTK